MVTVIGVLLIIMGIFLVISVLMQSSKNHRVSGSIAGGAETFFGKQKGKTLDSLFNKLTTVVTIIFVILVLVLGFIIPTTEEVRIQTFIDAYEELGCDITEDDIYVTEDGNIDFVDYEAFVEKNPQLLTVVEEAPVEGEEAPVEGEEAPVEGEETPAEGEEAPVEGEEAPVEGEEVTEEVVEEATEEVVEEVTEEVVEETPEVTE